jgi:fructose-bisphosphate aldolase class I
MNTQIQTLVRVANALVAQDKGLLAADESESTCNKRFAALDIPQTEAARRSYRELLLNAPGLAESINGVILCDETVRQKTADGIPFLSILADAGILSGIKVDFGAKDMAGFAGEKITEGLDGLRDRLKEYAGMGLQFAKWRAVITIGEALPTTVCIEANAHALARYAALCQETGLVPIVEPEVLMDGKHEMEQCGSVTEEVLNAVFDHLYRHRVLLEGMILKPNMVLPALGAKRQESVLAVADATIRCMRRTVPAAVAGVTFLSGGQSPQMASARLNAMNRNDELKPPWPLAFSFARAIQQPVLEIWRGKDENVARARQALYHRAISNCHARKGTYDALMDRESGFIPTTQ